MIDPEVCPKCHGLTVSESDRCLPFCQRKDHIPFYRGLYYAHDAVTGARLWSYPLAAAEIAARLAPGYQFKLTLCDQITLDKPSVERPSKIGRAIAPKPGWRHFGCVECGNVRMVPNVGRPAPWCIHHGGEYSWRAPSSPESDWTQMKPVRVRVERKVLKLKVGVAR